MYDLLVEASTISQLFTINTILESNLIKFEKAILLLSDNTNRPEAWSNIKNGLRTFNELASKFDKICILNDIIYPFHPSTLDFSKENQNSILRLKDLIGASYVESLLLESIHVSPGLFLASIYENAAINVYADGLMVYSPTRFDLPGNILKRIKKVFFFDYIPSLKPFLLVEAEPEYHKLSKEIYKKIINSYSNIREENKKNIVITGQYLSILGIFTYEEERLLYREILKSEYERYGEDYNYIFRNHPSCTISYERYLKDYAEKNGIPLKFDNSLIPMECLYSDKNTIKNSGLFSTSLFTLNFLYNINTESYFCDEVYDKLKPFENSNRIPIIISYLMFDKNIKELLDYDTFFYILYLNCLASHYNRFKNVINFVDDVKLLHIFKNVIYKSCDKSNNLNQFIGLPLIIIEKHISLKNENKLKSDQGNKSFLSFRKEAEKAIEEKNYNLAKEYFIKALAIRPGNTNCLKRLAAISCNYKWRWLALKLTNKYKRI